MDPFTLGVSRSILTACVTDPAPILMVPADVWGLVAVGAVLRVHGPIPEDACRLQVTAVAGRDPLAVAVTLLTICRICGGPISPYDALCDQRCFLCWVHDLAAEPPAIARAPLSPLPLRTYTLQRRPRRLRTAL